MIYTPYLSLDFTPAAWALIAASAVCAAIATLLVTIRMRRISRRVTADDEEPLPVDGYPSASVVVYAQSDAANLRVLLRQILEQDYPAPLEVIVVNDEKDPATEDLMSELELRYNNLYMTFAPQRSRNLSRRKLCLTLGLKAARYDAVVLTCGNCRINSPIWLRLMLRHFIQGKQVVIGTSLPGIAEGDEATATRLSRTTTFDLQWDAARTLSTAIAGRPYMGDGCNLAYSKQLFFDNKGFSKTLNLMWGDDDIFISEVADGDNAAVELAPDARILQVETDPEYMRRVYKLRRMFTARFLPRAPYRVMGLCPTLGWAAIICAAAAISLSLPSLITAGAALLIIIATTLPAMIAWRHTGRALGFTRTSFWTQPLLMLWHPFYNIPYRRRERRERQEQYTWGRKV